MDAELRPPRMRIVFSSDWYSEGMGYAENVLPAALARRGHEVFLVTSTMQIYGDHEFYAETYERFLGPPRVEPGSKVVGGVKVLRLPIALWWKRIRWARGRLRTIVGLRPDVVFAWDPRSLQTVALALTSPIGRFRIFSAVHTQASVYPAYYHFAEMRWVERLRLRLTETLFGWLAGRFLTLCYAITPDAAEIATRFFGIPAGSVKLLSTGVDTHHFRPPSSASDWERRAAVRDGLGYAPGDLVCIYTGRLTRSKNPRVLAKAVARLRSREMQVRGLFLGEGEQAAEIEGIEGCDVRPFTPFATLGEYYRAADIAVWPREDSISMLDAAACGLPIVVSNRMKALERIEGNGLTYRENDVDDLADTLVRLADPTTRAQLGRIGTEKVRSHFGMDAIAESLERDFLVGRSNGSPIEERRKGMVDA